MHSSEFDGTLLGYIGYGLLATLITVLTAGICTPWAYVILKRWEIEHTIIDGKRLRFDGKPMDLFGQWIKWWFFTIITVGIYGFWVGIKMKQWETRHTHFA